MVSQQQSKVDAFDVVVWVMPLGKLMTDKKSEELSAFEMLVPSSNPSGRIRSNSPS